MRPVVDVTLDKVIEALLLLGEVVACGLGGLFFEGQMHTLAAPVLLWAAGFDAFDTDAQTQPPDGEPAQAKKSVGRGERHSVIGPNRCGQSEVLECARKNRKRAGFLDRFQALAGEQIARVVVGDGERVAIAFVAEAELPLEVGTPEFVG